MENAAAMKNKREEEKIPTIKKMKRKSSEDEGMEVYNKRRKMTRPLADLYKKSRKRAKSKDGDVTVTADFYTTKKRGKSTVEEDDDDGDITVMEVYKKIKRMQSLMSSKRRKTRTRRRLPIFAKKIVEMSSSEPIPKKGSPIPKKGAENVEARFFEYNMSSEEDSEEDKKHIRRSPVYIKTYYDYVDLEACGIKVNKEAEVESDEELLEDRYEVDHGYNYVLKKRWKTVTNLKNPERTYYKSSVDNGSTLHVLHDPQYPLATFSKLALKTYNDIQGTHYEYVGLVKAYMRFIGGWNFWLRFKARVVGQDAINFQAIIYQDFRNRKTNVVPVCVEFVHPLPPC